MVKKAKDSCGIRLNVFVARAAGLSRRKADAAISAGRIEIDGEVVDRYGYRIAEGESVTLDGRRLRLPPSNIWILMNKPGGYITTRSDPFGRKTVMELLPKNHRNLFPVGRLDYETTGVLLFTNDGNMAQRMLHPSYGVPRSYLVEIVGKLSTDEIEIARRGVILDGRRAVPSRMEMVKQDRNSQSWRIDFHEGRYHEVRRFFGSIGHEVISIERFSFAEIEVGDLTMGGSRVLTAIEVKELKKRLERYAGNRD
jgi:23S rRNA pseudouridine2605 synthase